MTQQIWKRKENALYFRLTFSVRVYRMRNESFNRTHSRRSATVCLHVVHSYDDMIPFHSLSFQLSLKTQTDQNENNL